VQAGDWIHVVGIADGQNSSIYKNGVLKQSQSYARIITPQHGTAPLRIATRDFNSFFLGASRKLRCMQSKNIQFIEAGRDILSGSIDML